MTTQPAAPRTTEWDATSYHRVSNPHVAWGGKVLDRLPLRGDETVLDAGCGTGRLTADLLERLPAGRVVALDASANMLDVAERELAPRFGDRVRFVRADLQAVTPELVGGPVDAVFSTATFHWVPNHDRLFRGLFSVLAPGGWLVAQCGGGPNLAALRARADALLAVPPFAEHIAGWPGPWTFATDAETAIRLASAGFVDVRTDLEEQRTPMGDEAAYREFLTTVILGDHLGRLPSEELRAALVDALAAGARADEPPFELDYWRLNLQGRRPS